MFVSVCAATGRAIVCGSSCFVITIGEIRKRLDPELFFLSLWRNDTHSENHWKNMSHLISMPVWHGLPSRLPLWRQLLQSESCKFHSFFWVFCVRPVSSFDLGAIHSQKCTKSRTNHRESNRHFPAVRFVLLAASLSVCPGNGAGRERSLPAHAPRPQVSFHNFEFIICEILSACPAGQIFMNGGCPCPPTCVNPNPVSFFFATHIMPLL